MVSVTEEAFSSNRTATSLAQTYDPAWGCEAGGCSRGGRGGRGGPEEAQGAVVVDKEHDQAEQTYAISAAGATTSTAIAPIRLTVGEW